MSVKIKNVIVLLSALLLISADMADSTQHEPKPQSLDRAVTLAANQWVESIFNGMTEEERIGQLIMLRAHSDKGADHIAHVERMIRDYKVGSLCFFQGTPEKQAELTNRYQAISKVPLMVAMDAEWGLGMRLKSSTISFPRHLTLGAIQDNRLVYDLGVEIARQLRRLGVHFNFAPVLDVNNNANNPVINTRSFGEDRYNVAAKGYMYMKGMQDHGVLASAKHFPGHGDTDVDSHHDLPVINHNMNRLDSIELFPFRVLSQHGIASTMVAHLSIPTIDATPNQPTTLSRKAVNDLLIDDIGFEGLIVTDGLEMKGVTKYYSDGEVEAKAIQAGNDILLLPEDTPAAVRRIKEYVQKGLIPMEQIHKSVKKILLAKYQLGLHNYQPIALSNLRNELNTPEAYVLKEKLIANALTLVRNKDNLIPFRDLEYRKFASLSIGSRSRTDFQNMLDKYTKATHYNLGKSIPVPEGNAMLGKLRDYDVVLVSLHDMSSFARKDYGLNKDIKGFIEALRKETQVVLCVMGSPYSTKFFDELDWLVVSYDEDKLTQELTAQALFGAFGFKGRLPVTASAKSRYGAGLSTPGLLRMGYTRPEAVGLRSEILDQIDVIAQEAINTRATPGCVVLVAKDGKVVFNKAYGHHTYAKSRRAQPSDIYDLASVTKIAASTLSTMRLHEQGKINVNSALSNYLTELKGGNKSNMLIADMMAHRAGLPGWIKFYEQTLSKSSRTPRPSSKYYKSQPTGNYVVPVAERLYMNLDFTNEMWKQIRDIKMRSTTNYKYSDLGFYLISDMVNRVSGQTIDKYVEKQFYRPLGLTTATYNPLYKYPKERIPPTEEDKYFRKRKIQGYVHDMGAAMLGGVSGHAGLFANANDVAIIMQMLLNNGYYGGKQYFQPETVRLFTTRFPGDTRRGLGFDMKELNPNRSQNMSQLASASTFGHLGFTGICTWADPVNNIVYVFLSNRTYPSMNNYKLSKEDYRPRIQRVIYEAMKY
ncbi:MAG: glycoside hydrolase family 3 N-terminal domain-containing protein [Bacteroidota bacterium]